MPFSQDRLDLPLHALIAEARQQRRINHPPQPRGHTGHFAHHGRGGFTPGPSRWPRNPQVSGEAAYPTQPIIPGYIRREKHFVGWSPGVEGSTTLVSKLDHGVGDIEECGIGVFTRECRSLQLEVLGNCGQGIPVFNFAPVHEMLPPITIFSLKQPCPVSQRFLHHQRCGPAVHTLTGFDQWSYHHGDSSSCKPAKATGTLPAADGAAGGASRKRKREDDFDYDRPSKRPRIVLEEFVDVYWLHLDRRTATYLDSIAGVNRMMNCLPFHAAVHTVLRRHQRNFHRETVYYSEWTGERIVRLSLDAMRWNDFRSQVKGVIVFEDEDEVHEE